MIHLKGGRIIDPANNRDEIGDLYIKNGRIAPRDPAGFYQTIDVTGKIVMAGAIDIHSHIAGGNVNVARLILPDAVNGQEPPIPGKAFAGVCWPASETGRLYAQMGFTTVVEPAMALNGALKTHIELADIPYIDRGALVILGNEDFLLRLLRERPGGSLLKDYVAWAVQSAKELGVKVINPGGAAAFKENVRSFSLDDVVPAYGLTSRDIFTALQRVVYELGIPHPLHLHTNNLGIPGNIESILATIEASGGLPLHLAHIQFYSYGKTKRGGLSSEAARLAEAVLKHRNVTVDIGQVMFGQTITISSDVLRQFAARSSAHPKKWVIWDGDGNGGGIVPYNYRSTNAVSALQWAIGLELFLLIDDPWRVFFTTDHPNGGPFTAYPKMLHLLMDAGERARFMETLPQKAFKTSLLGQLKREYSLYEIAIMTRAAPARLLGTLDRGHLGDGAIADIAVYTDRPDKTAMFAAADYVFKDGVMIVKEVRILAPYYGRTLTVKPEFDKQLAPRLQSYYGEFYGTSPETFSVPSTFAGHKEPVFSEQGRRI